MAGGGWLWVVVVWGVFTAVSDEILFSRTVNGSKGSRKFIAFACKVTKGIVPNLPITAVEHLSPLDFMKTRV